MVSVTEVTPYLSGLLAGVTVMTLMTLIYGLILDRGTSLLRRLSYCFKLPDEPDAGSRKSYFCTVLEPIICVGFSQIG
jgi:hypothetical protein